MDWTGPLAPGQFWGKLDRSDKTLPPRAWHPLEDHCVDVACCAEALLTRTLLGDRLATLGGQASLHPAQIARLCVLAGMHDLGKFNHGFQAKDGRGGPTAGHVSEGVSLVYSARRTAAYQDALNLGLLGSWGQSVGQNASLQLLIASVSHHGRPGQLEPHGAVDSLWRERAGHAPLVALRRLTERLLQMFPDALADNVPPLPSAPAFQHAFMGLMTLADWLGSDRREFVYSREGDPPREVFARPTAARLLLRSGLDGASARARLGGVAPDFTRLTRRGFPPRPLQTTVLNLPLPDGPSLTLIEAETGSGKTEAALARFFALYAAGRVDGMFFAVPTRAAAAQLHRRVFEAVAGTLGEDEVAPPVVLAVPGYLRVDGDEGRRGLAAFEVLWTDDPTDANAPRRWAAENSKRFLAGAVVVGTVDQALLGALAVNHSHLRATSLLRQLLVVDEVHASDPYMTRLLRTLLRRQREAGGHALLMSATYADEARAILMDEPAAPNLAAAVAAPFPRVSERVGAQRIDHVVQGSAREKRVSWSLQPVMPAPEAVVEQALDAAQQGARVIVLRNTVRDALLTQAALEAQAAALGVPEALLFSCEGRLCPHHGRFAPEDRRRLDLALERRFEAPGGLVVVSTQTLEQSLDIDADLLITDLCPIDVLLQRVGRLHRHARARPAGFEEARCVVLTPPEPDSLLTIIRRGGDGKGPYGWGTVYSNLLALQSTWALLRARPVARVPAENRALVEGALHSEVYRALLEEDPRWAAHRERLMGRAMAERVQADLNLSRWEANVTDQSALFPDDGRKLPTRLGEEGRRLRLTPPARSPFGATLTEINLPAHQSQDVPGDVEAVTITQDVEGFTFEAGRPWRYTRRGLERVIA